MLFQSKLKLELHAPSKDVPFFTVIVQRVFEPDPQCLLAPMLIEEVFRARPGPVLPFIDVAVMNRVVMNVIQARPKVPLRSDESLESVKPALAATLIVLAIPFERRAPVKLAELFQQRFDLFRAQQNVVVIGQETPGVNVRPEIGAGFHQFLLTLGHSLICLADNVAMFVTGGRDQIEVIALDLPVR